MEIAVTPQLLRTHEHAVLATWRRDGRLQLSPVTGGLHGAGRAIISSRDTASQVRNLRRDPRAACASSSRLLPAHGSRSRARPKWTSGGVGAKTSGCAQQENLRVNQQRDVDV